MNLLFSLLAGLVFGLGLILAGMADPSKVLGFLDLAGPWDPSLAYRVTLGPPRDPSPTAPTDP